MKSLCILAVVLCLAYVAVGKPNEVCDKNSDCEEGECCVQISRFISAKCKPLRKEFHLCFPEIEKHLDNDKYSYMCPCAEGLTCEAQEKEEDGGVTTYKNAKCKKSA
ncbi:prokineticin domain-containing protein [Caerostris darwini]|uniref:Prokineticin domain-containing protein n=1 Tax=Caerostris darwini TaxID=1538125 RepID=A0AAV4S6Q0_9ARAC|nr:prokineticin domain-containing protein [Caerostris darwini]